LLDNPQVNEMPQNIILPNQTPSARWHRRIEIVPFVSIGGVTLHHRYRPTTGNARPIIFMNSLGTDFRIWDEIVSALDGEMPLLVKMNGQPVQVVAGVGAAPMKATVEFFRNRKLEPWETVPWLKSARPGRHVPSH